ncbi:hypothetical protein OESDEN_08108 [Oesophagostomum dentatum]|uniref:Uncharacterized protein n=1 Tax=Oesophagostomum dentatum TaxID=61180 RepID=A0A0B1T364_OESDE|nr:hypothetical protein OESDEN_08108 [Oesophagostomum dentatum]
MLAFTAQLVIFVAVIQMEDFLIPVSSLSLLERHKEKLEHPKQRLHNILTPVVHDNIVDDDVKHRSGHKSILKVGSFRGRPIMSRQNSVYVDSDGDAHSILPYNEASQRIHSRPNLYGQG